MSKDHVVFGWGAPSMKEQFPQLSDSDAEHFDKDNQALTRLRLRGYLTDSQRDPAIKKMTREVARALQKAIPPAETQEEKQGEKAA